MLIIFFFIILNSLFYNYNKLFLSFLISSIFIINTLNKLKLQNIIILYLLNVLWYILINRILFYFYSNRFIKYNLSFLYKELYNLYIVKFNSVLHYKNSKNYIFSFLFVNRKVVDLFIKCYDQVLMLLHTNKEDKYLIELFKIAINLYENIFSNFIFLNNININNDVLKEKINIKQKIFSSNINFIFKKILDLNLNKYNVCFKRNKISKNKNDKLYFLFFYYIDNIIYVLNKQKSLYKEPLSFDMSLNINKLFINNKFSIFKNFNLFILWRYLNLFLLIFLFIFFLGLKNRFYCIFVTCILTYQNNITNTKLRITNRLYGTILGLIISLVITKFLIFKKYILLFLFFFMFFSYFFLRLFYNISVLNFILVNICNLKLIYLDIKRFLFLRFIDIIIVFLVVYIEIFFLYPQWNIIIFTKKVLQILGFYNKILEKTLLENVFDLKKICYMQLILLKEFNDLFNFYINFKQEININKIFIKDFKLLIYYNTIIVSHINSILVLVKEKNIKSILLNKYIIDIYIKIINIIVKICKKNIRERKNYSLNINYLLKEINYFKKTNKIFIFNVEYHLDKIVVSLLKIKSISIVIWEKKLYLHHWLFKIFNFFSKNFLFLF